MADYAYKAQEALAVLQWAPESMSEEHWHALGLVRMWLEDEDTNAAAILSILNVTAMINDEG